MFFEHGFAHDLKAQHHQLSNDDSLQALHQRTHTHTRGRILQMSHSFYIAATRRHQGAQECKNLHLTLPQLPCVAAQHAAARHKNHTARAAIKLAVAHAGARVYSTSLRLAGSRVGFSPAVSSYRIFFKPLHGLLLHSKNARTSWSPRLSSTPPPRGGMHASCSGT